LNRYGRQDQYTFQPTIEMMIDRGFIYNPIRCTLWLPAEEAGLLGSNGIDWMTERHDAAQPRSAVSLARMARQKPSPKRQQSRRTHASDKAAAR
jgi:hypothetical protein